MGVTPTRVAFLFGPDSRRKLVPVNVMGGVASWVMRSMKQGCSARTVFDGRGW